jgi:hypothetical protein
MMIAHLDTLDSVPAGLAICTTPVRLPAPDAEWGALAAVLAGPVSTPEDMQSLIQNVPFAQTPGGAPLLFPGADTRLTESEPGTSIFPGDAADSSAYGAETPFDCGSGSSIDGDMDWLVAE